MSDRPIKGLFAARAVCLGLICGLGGGGMVSWGITHDQRLVIFYGVTVAVLAVVVMLLNWKLND